MTRLPAGTSARRSCIADRLEHQDRRHRLRRMVSLMHASTYGNALTFSYLPARGPPPNHLVLRAAQRIGMPAEEVNHPGERVRGRVLAGEQHRQHVARDVGVIHAPPRCRAPRSSTRSGWSAGSRSAGLASMRARACVMNCATAACSAFTCSSTLLFLNQRQVGQPAPGGVGRRHGHDPLRGHRRPLRHSRPAERGIRTLGRHLCRHTISNRARSAAPAPLRDGGEG